MHRIAVIFESSPFDRKGLFNAVHNRILHLKEIVDCEIDAFCIHSWDTPFTLRMRHTTKIADHCDTYSLDGIEYKMLWYDFSIIDHILLEKLHIRPFFFRRFLKKSIGLLAGYDVVLAHSFTGGLMALENLKFSGVPYIVTWHGSDIHTHPWRNPVILDHTQEVIGKAFCNCFVSSTLLDASEKILSGGRKEILYNGVSEAFRRFTESERTALRERYDIRRDEKVVAFVGSIVGVKNVMSLQPIFHEIRARYSGGLKFWMVGDGKLRGVVEPDMEADSTIDVRLWGNVPAEEMPAVMNCIDVMILPSINEGLPLVCAEAIRCGASVAGSEVGGIPEVIGLENTVPLGDGFVADLSNKAVEMLHNPQPQSLPSELDWTATAAKELAIIKEIL